MKVFDISFCQDTDLWNDLISEGAEGVIISIGETIMEEQELDDLFEAHISEAVVRGVKFGVYFVTHAVTKEEALKEAKWINDTIQKYLDGQEPELGIWIDCEVGAVQTIATHTNVMALVDQLLGFGFSQVGIYASYTFFTDYFDLRDLTARRTPIWCASYGHENRLKEEYPDLNHIGWQYTENYKKMFVDANVWY